MTIFFAFCLAVSVLNICISGLPPAQASAPSQLSLLKLAVWLLQRPRLLHCSLQNMQPPPGWPTFVSKHAIPDAKLLFNPVGPWGACIVEAYKVYNKGKRYGEDSNKYQRVLTPSLPRPVWVIESPHASPVSGVTVDSPASVVDGTVHYPASVRKQRPAEASTVPYPASTLFNPTTAPPGRSARQSLSPFSAAEHPFRAFLGLCDSEQAPASVSVGWAPPVATMSMDYVPAKSAMSRLRLVLSVVSCKTQYKRLSHHHT